MEQEIWLEYYRRYLVNQYGVSRLYKIYEVSNFGRIRINGVIKEFNFTEEYLQTHYIQAPGLYNSKRIRLHVLVATLFVPNPYNKPQIDHIDGRQHRRRQAKDAQDALTYLL